MERTPAMLPPLNLFVIDIIRLVSISKCSPLIETKDIGRNNPNINNIGGCCWYFVFGLSLQFKFPDFYFSKHIKNDSCDLSTCFYFVSKALLNGSANKSNQSTLFLIYPLLNVLVWLSKLMFKFLECPHNKPSITQPECRRVETIKLQNWEEN